MKGHFDLIIGWRSISKFSLGRIEKLVRWWVGLFNATQQKRQWVSQCATTNQCGGGSGIATDGHTEVSLCGSPLLHVPLLLFVCARYFAAFLVCLFLGPVLSPCRVDKHFVCRCDDISLHRHTSLLASSHTHSTSPGRYGGYHLHTSIACFVFKPRKWPLWYARLGSQPSLSVSLPPKALSIVHIISS